MGSQVVFYLTPLVTDLLALLVTPPADQCRHASSTTHDGLPWLELWVRARDLHRSPGGKTCLGAGAKPA